MNVVITDVREFLKVQLRVPNAEELSDDFPLVKRGVLDSIELMQLVGFLEKRYAIRIDDTDILPENLGSLEAIALLVDRKRQSA